MMAWLAGKQNMDINWQTGRSSLPVLAKKSFQISGAFSMLALPSGLTAMPREIAIALCSLAAACILAFGLAAIVSSH
jgi:hypothetical protein